MGRKSNDEIRDLIWDFDGTLYDTYAAMVKAFASVLRGDFGIQVATDRLHRLVKIDTRHCAEQLARHYGLDSAVLLSAARARYDAGASRQTPFADVKRALSLVQARGGHNFLVTHRDRASLQHLLRQEGLQNAFRAIVCADDGFALKPSPASFDHLIERHALNRRYTAAIGDRELDVRAANSAAIRSIYFCPNGGSHSEASDCISHFGQLCELLQPTAKSPCA